MLVRKLQRDESLVKDAIAVLRCPVSQPSMYHGGSSVVSGDSASTPGT